MINEKIESELDKQFPKGNKARGRALVLFAICQIELNKLEEKRRYWEKRFKNLQEVEADKKIIKMDKDKRSYEKKLNEEVRKLKEQEAKA